MANYDGLNYYKTKAGKYYVPVLHRSFSTMKSTKIAIRKWVHKQLQRDKPWENAWKIKK